jgi:hypothetical protein
MSEQGGNMSKGGGGSGGGSTRAWTFIVGSVGAGTSGRVSSNFITEEDAQGTSSEGVIIGDTGLEIDGGSERVSGGAGSWRWVSSHSSSV